METSPTVMAFASSGGHLTQLLAVLKALPELNVHLVTDDGVGDLGEAVGKGWSVLPKVGRAPSRQIANAGRQLVLVGRLRPRLIITTGSGWCLPAVLLVRLFGGRSMAIESFARVERPSLFGKVAYLFANRTLVQWPDILETLPRATLVQPVFSAPQPGTRDTGVGTFVTVGTHDKGMDRLVEAVDGLAAEQRIPSPVFIQVGTGAFTTKHCEWTRTLGREEFSRRLAAARLVVCHAGAGIIGECMMLGKVPLVVARDPGRGEVVDDHQRRMAARLAETELIRFCPSERELGDFLAASPARNAASPALRRPPPAERLPSAASIVRAELGG